MDLQSTEQAIQTTAEVPGMGQITQNLFSALHAMHFVHRGEPHFGACGIRNTDHCTTPVKCTNAKKALKEALDSQGGCCQGE